MNERQFLSMEQRMACAESSQGKTSSATAGQTDLDSKAAATIAARRATWSQSAVLATGSAIALQGIRTVAYGASAVGASNDDWVIDSGASKHLTPHSQHLRNYRSMAPNSAVTFVSGHQAAAVGQGQVILCVQTASGCTDVTLKAVLHVPEATVNLFSTRQAMNNGAQITFRDNRCFVLSDDTMAMEGVSQRDGTMVIRQSSSQHMHWQPQQQPSNHQSYGIGALDILAMTTSSS